MCCTSKNKLFTCSPTIYPGTSLACPNHLPVRTAGAGGEDLDHEEMLYLEDKRQGHSPHFNGGRHGNDDGGDDQNFETGSRKD